MRCFVETSEIEVERLERNHGGIGPILFRRLLKHGDFLSPVDFVDFTVIPPGSTIGRHKHADNDEMYLIVSGTAIVEVGQEQRRLSRGAVAVVHSGESHSLTNGGDTNVEIFVVQVRWPERRESCG